MFIQSSPNYHMSIKAFITYAAIVAPPIISKHMAAVSVEIGTTPNTATILSVMKNKAIA